MEYLLLIIILVISFFLINKFPVGMFMVGLTIHFNIGNYLDKNLFGFPNFFTFHDFGLVFAFIAGLSAGKFQLSKLTKEFKSLLTILFFFVLYQIIVSIIINLNLTNKPGEIILELAYHKWRIFSIFICIPAYFAIQKNAKTIFNYIVIISALVLSAFFITLLTPIKLIETQTLLREFLLGAQRIWFENYGYIQLTLIMGLTVYLMKINLNKKENALLFWICCFHFSINNFNQWYNYQYARFCILASIFPNKIF